MSTTKTKSKVSAQKRTVHKTVVSARFDARLSVVQKRIFEEAARIKGYKSLSEFVIHTTMEAATIIIEKHRAILVSENDKKIFFDTLVNPPKPGKDLIKAAKYYHEEVSAK